MLAFRNLLSRSALVLISVFLLNFSAMPEKVQAKEKAPVGISKITKAETIESKGTMEPVIELVNGNNFQQNPYHLKKNSSTQTSVDVASALLAHVSGAAVNAADHAHSIPLYIAYRSILI